MKTTPSDRFSLVPVFKVLAVWPLCILLFPILGRVVSYTLQQITELQEVPLILQGGTDCGGSWMYALYISAHLVFGFIASLHLTLLLNLKPSGGILAALVKDRYMFYSYFLAFGLINSVCIVSEAIEVAYYETSYFLCEYVQVLVIISLTYAVTIFWILRLSKRVLPFTIKLFAAPVFIILLVALGSDGITPKAGQIVQAGEVPQYNPRNFAHAGFIELHKLCMLCASS